MATITMPLAGVRGRQVLVVRFTAAERAAHWVHFVAFSVLLVTGMFIYLPWLHAFAGGAAGEASRLIHRGAAVLFIAAPLVYLVFSPREFLYSLKESFTWGADDVGWLKNAWGYYSQGKLGTMPPQGKYNSGQKLNALTQIISFGLFVITGLIMWFGKGSVPSNVFLASVIVHDLAVIATVLLFMLHLYLVVLHPMMRESITSMFEGTVTRAFAEEHHGKWYSERVLRKREEEFDPLSKK
ncbi:MAG: cytochrome b/b6 domain-containing protein [Chloroflexi bacterium]|nr:cytochrome b/b6 domain-containing protein [Chloroflexota bacterium]MCL5950119.1 cytochrome b/b6 domain-containing protein [Chloroflexota bacterium]